MNIVQITYVTRIIAITLKTADVVSTKTFLAYGLSWVCLHFDFYAWGGSVRSKIAEEVFMKQVMLLPLKMVRECRLPLLG